MANHLLEKIFRRFPQIIPEISDIVLKIMQKDRDQCLEYLNAIIESEKN